MNNEISHFPEPTTPWKPSADYTPPKKAAETIPVPTEAVVEKLPVPLVEWTPSVQRSQVKTAAEYAASGALLDFISAPGQEPYFQSAPQVEQAVPVKGRFGETDDSIFVFDKDKEKVTLTNFTLEITALFRRIELKGQSRSYIGLRLRSQKHQAEFEVSLADYQKLEAVLKREHPEFHVYAANVKGEPLFRDYLSKRYEEALAIMRWQNLYAFAGWHEVQLGAWHYLSGADKYCRSAKCLPDVSGVNMAAICRHIFGVLQIANLDTMLPLFLAAHIDVLLCPFELAGHPVQHVLVIVGPTNSKKTSVAKMLYCHFDMTDIINFTATEVAMERNMEKAHDGILVLDDMASAKDRITTDKLNYILRQVCDSTGREKTVNGGKETERADTRCIVVVTAESDPDSLQQSGKVRLLTVSVNQQTFDEAALREYQKDLVQARLQHQSTCWECYKTGFIRFIEADFSEIVATISAYESPYRFRFPRQTESFMQYVILAKLIMRFYRVNGFLSDEIAETILQEQWIPCIWRWIKANEMRCAEDDPVLLFLAALANGIARNQLIIAPDRKAFIEGKGTASGFWDDIFLAILPESGYEYAVAYYAKLGRSITATANDIVAFLYDRGISEGYEQKGRKGKPLKKIKIDGLTIPILYLRRDKIKRLLDAQGEQIFVYQEEEK